MSSNDANTSRLESWFKEYGLELKRYICRSLMSDADVDDLLQQVFLVALRRKGDYTEKGQARAYLYRIAHNLILASRRKKRWQQFTDTELVDESTEPTTGIQKEALVNSAQHAWKTISPDQKVVIRLRLSQDLPFKEIAKLLDLSVNTVISRFHRGISRMRRHSGTEQTE